jgi:hypothetical protein
MFSAGLEIDLALFRKVRNKSYIFGVLTTTLPLLQVKAQVAARGIADAEFLNEPGIVHSPLREILNALRITV